MTHACARDGGETPAPRKIDEPRQRREAASKRAPWCPDNAGPYRLPGGIRDRLTAALAGFKNREAAFALAVFLGRFWSSPSRLPCAFPIDRRALAEHEALELTEARVRGALLVLIGVGFLTRCEPEAGKRYQRTEGGLQRRAILHRFGEEFAVEFGKANARAQAARGAPAPARRPIPPSRGGTGASGQGRGSGTRLVGASASAPRSRPGVATRPKAKFPRKGNDYG